VLQGQHLPPAATQHRHAEQRVKQQQAPIDHGEQVDLGLDVIQQVRMVVPA
jgi:hypothetical protein